MIYYSCFNNINDEASWFLSDLTYIDSGEDVPDVFQLAHRFEPDGKMAMNITRDGESTHFSTFAFDIPIASVDFVDSILELCPNDCQLIPVKVIGVDRLFFIVNVLQVVDCVDEVNTTYFKRWTEQDGRKDKIGDYKGLCGLRVDEFKISKEVHLFRPKGWRRSLIVSQKLKSKIEELGVNGITFKRC